MFEGWDNLGLAQSNKRLLAFGRWLPGRCRRAERIRRREFGSTPTFERFEAILQWSQSTSGQFADLDNYPIKHICISSYPDIYSIAIGSDVRCIYKCCRIFVGPIELGCFRNVAHICQRQR